MGHPVVLAAGAAAALVLSGCASATGAVSAEPVHAVQVSAEFGTGSGTAITYDPALVPVGAKGMVSANSADGSTTVALTVSGLVPNHRYGAHVHTKPCGAKGADAGPHFQFEQDPVQPSVDPRYANDRNEIWLDLTTDDTGAGTGRSTVAWTFPADRRPHSVVVHAMGTATDAGKAGTAGERAACISVDF